MLPFYYLSGFVRQLSAAWFAKPLEEVRILDWGCGKGQMTYLLAPQMTCVSADVIGNAGDSAFGQTTPILDSLGTEVVPLEHPSILPFADAEFDVVLSQGVLEHVPDDRASALEIRRVLRPGGLFFCHNLPYAGSWTQRVAHSRGDSYHDRLYTKRGTKALIGAAGFSMLDIWHRQLLPKNTVHWPLYARVEYLDQLVTEFTPLGLAATNLEFVATR